MEDAVRPSEKAFRAMYVHGYNLWSHLYNSTKQEEACELHWDCLRNIDNAFPQFPRLPLDLKVHSPVDGIAIATGTSAWETSKTTEDLPTIQQELQLQVATAKPRPVTITRQPPIFSEWLPDGDSHVTILVFAWTYVLAARWVELLVSGASVEYGETQSTWSDGTSSGSNGHFNSVTVDLGNVDDHAGRWWAAVLAPGEGWKAQLKLENRPAMYAPWSTKLNFACNLTLSRYCNRRPCANVPSASYKDALSYLYSYVSHHKVFDQSRAALSAALFLPVVTYDSRNLELPAPCFNRKKENGATSHSNQPPLVVTEALVDRLLALSCNASGMKAILHSVLFQPDIPCNLSGPWVQGAHAVFKNCTSEILARTLMMRDPGIGFLWAGAFIMGVDKNFLSETFNGRWRVDFTVGVLTGTNMSFMEGVMPAMKLDTAEISRADECRLRYLCIPGVQAPVSFAFPPFGSTKIRDLDFVVRPHVTCGTPHSLEFKYFTWNTRNVRRNPDVVKAATRRQKNGNFNHIERNIRIPEELDRLNDQCSKAVSNFAFTWLREDAFRKTPQRNYIFMEDAMVWPVAERAIFEHEWIDVSQPLEDTKAWAARRGS